MVNRVDWNKGAQHSVAVMVALLSISIFGVGCSKSDSGTSGPELTAADYLAQGWGAFENAYYDSALVAFNTAIARDNRLADAYNGYGWTMGKLQGHISEAPAQFAHALQLDTARYDALGGWAFAAYQLGNWQSAIEKSDSLLHRRPGWRFLHESTLDQSDIYIMRAAAYYNLGDFAASFSVVVNYLNASFEADISTPAGRRELLDEIERLRRVYG